MHDISFARACSATIEHAPPIPSSLAGETSRKKCVYKLRIINCKLKKSTGICTINGIQEGIRCIISVVREKINEVERADCRKLKL